MVDMGESVSITVRREFTEEAGAIEDPEKKVGPHMHRSTPCVRQVP